MLKSNIFGIPPRHPATGLLLDSGLTAPIGAWSVNERLRTAYSSNLLQVRDSTTTTTTNIGYNGSNVLDRTAVATACPSGHLGTIATLYDQSGNSRNLTNATAARQPAIYNGSAVLTSGGNVIFTNNAGNSADGLTRSDSCGLTGDHDVTIFLLGKTSSTADQQYWVKVGSSANGYVIGRPGSTNLLTTWGTNPGDNIWTSSVGTAYQYIIASYSASANGDDVYQNGSTLSHSTYNTAAINMANTQTAVGYAFAPHSLSTVIIWDVILSSGERSVLNAWAETRRTA